MRRFVINPKRIPSDSLRATFFALVVRTRIGGRLADSEILATGARADIESHSQQIAQMPAYKNCDFVMIPLTVASLAASLVPAA